MSSAKFIIIIAGLSLALIHELAPPMRADEIRILDGNTKTTDTERSRSTPGAAEDKSRAQAEADGVNKMETIRLYFELEGFSVGELEPEQLARYDQQSVEKMAQALDKKQDISTIFRLNWEINKLLYEFARSRTNKIEPPLELDDEVLFETLEAIVPDSGFHEDYRAAKDELRDFCREQIGRCRELLDQLRIKLELGELHTMDAMMMLDDYLHSWIPYGRLTKFMEDSGQEPV